jgi:hypothetical protein
LANRIVVALVHRRFPNLVDVVVHVERPFHDAAGWIPVGSVGEPAEQSQHVARKLI